MARKYRTFLLLAGLMLFMGQMLRAQTYPVSGSTIFQPPFSVYLDQLTDPGKPRLSLQLNLNDLTEPSLDVRLKVSVEGNGMRLATREQTHLDPISLVPGGNFITTDQLAPYFNLNNLDVMGYSREALIQSGKLPEGFYTFCFEVYAYGRNVQISAPTCASATLRLNNPPIPVAPAQGATVSAAGAQNIPFNWIANHDPAVTAQYEFTLVEVPQGMNMNDAINGAQTPLLQDHVVNTNAFTYGPGEVQLTAGKKYAWRVKVVDPAQNAIFEHDGLCPTMSFNYGFNTGGSIALNAPAAGAAVTARNNVGLTWGGPDNLVPNQSLEYQVRVAKMETGQTAQMALQGGSLLVDELLPPTTTQFGSNYTIGSELEPSADYAWQVRAFTEGIEVAASDIRQFRAPAVIDEFFGANGTVACRFSEISAFTKVSETQYTGITGKVELPVDGAGTKATVDVTGIAITQTAGTWNLVGGEIAAPLVRTMDLDNGSNGEARFKSTAVVLRQNGFFISGRVEWDYPLPSSGGTLAQIISKVTELNYGGYVPNGGAFFDDNQTVSLMSPMGFVVGYDPTSYFQVAGTAVSLNMTGLVTLPAAVPTLSNEALPIPFAAVNNPFFFRNEGMNPATTLLLIDGSHVQLEPKRAVFDFSESKSEGAFVADPTWKGVFFNEYNVIFPTDGDGSGQLVLTDEISINLADAVSETKYFAVSGSGMSGNFVAPFDSAAGAYYAAFNTFPGKLHRLAYQIEDGMIQDAQLLGGIQVALVSRSALYDWVMPIAGNGFQSGYLEGDGLAGKLVVFNKGAEGSEVRLGINQAQFDNGNALKMNVNIAWPDKEIEINEVDNLKVWGDEGFGFTSPDGEQALTSQVQGQLDAFPIVVTSLQARKENAAYKIDFNGEIVLPGGASAEGGSDVSLEMDMAATDDEGGDEGDEGDGDGGDEEEEEEEEEADPTYAIAPIEFSIENPSVAVHGELEWVFGDEDWGDKFEGKLQAQFKLPTPFGGLVHVIIGSTESEEEEAFGYWFVRARLNGLNVPLGATGLALDGFDASLYHHMRHQTPEEREEGGMDGMEEEEDGPFAQEREEEEEEEGDDNGGDGDHEGDNAGGDGDGGDEGGGDGGDEEEEEEDEGMEGWGEQEFDLIPDIESSYGFSAKLGFKDAGSMGQAKIKVLWYAGLEMTFTNSGSISYVAVMGDFYFQADASNPYEDNIGYAQGKVEYYPATGQWAGEVTGGFKVPKESPKACVKGKVSFDIGGSNGWQFNIGTPYDPVRVAIGSCDGPQLQAYLGLNKEHIRFGLGYNVDFEWHSPTIDFTIAKANLSAEAEFGIKVDANIDYDPFVFRGKLSAHASASLGINWWTLVNSGRFTIIGAGLGGELSLVLPDFCASGRLYGEFTLLGESVDFEVAMRVTGDGVDFGGDQCF